MKTKMFIILSSVNIALSFSCHNSAGENMTIVHGLVVDSSSNLPIQDVGIQLYINRMFAEFPVRVSEIETTTDSLGKFSLEFESNEDFVSYYIGLKRKGYTFVSPHYSLAPINAGQKQCITLKMLKTN